MIPIVTVALALTAARVHAGQSAKPAAKPGAAAAEAVEVHGTLPESLKGTWLMIQSGEANKRFVNFWTVYTITHKGSDWSVEQLTGTAPPALASAINAANKAGQRLEPDDKLLAAVRTSIPKLKRPKVEERNKRYVFYTAENKPEGPAPELKDATLVLGVLSSAPDTRTSGNQYFFREVTPDKLSGRFHAGLVAMTSYAPLVPIAIRGDVAVYRLK